MDTRHPEDIKATLSRRERRKQRTRNLLKTTAADLLITKGYHALTIQDITDTADLARGTFYVHFKDKDEVIWAILQDSFESLNNDLYADLPRDPAAWRYEKWLRFFRYIQAHRDLLGVMIGDNGHIALYRRIAAYMAAFVQRDMESGRIPRMSALPVPFVAQFLAGAMMQVITWWLDAAPDTYSPAQMAAMYYELALGEPAPTTSGDG